MKRCEPHEIVSRETWERLAVYVDLLFRWNAKINLIGRADMATIWDRHIDDSLQLIPLLPPQADTAIDLGSGAGFPGLILAIATGIPFALVESDARKCAFLREAARIAEAPATIVHARIETAGIPKAKLITARALAPLSHLLAIATPHLAPGGTMLFPKGEAAESEIEDARSTWTMRAERHISQTSGGGVILRISEVARA